MQEIHNSWLSSNLFHNLNYTVTWSETVQLILMSSQQTPVLLLCYAVKYAMRRKPVISGVT